MSVVRLGPTGRREPLRNAGRWILALTLAAAPFAFGAVVTIAYVPLLCIVLAVGFVSWWLAGQRADTGGVPAWRWVVALNAVGFAQLVPVPPAVHRLLSPGSWALHYVPMPERPEWRALSVAPGDTVWGLAFLAGMSLVYATVARDFADEAWRRRLCLVLVAGSAGLTFVALAQAASPNPTTIYGRWRPAFDWAVFGPYVNRNHFAGYLELTAPVAIGFAVEALERAARAARRLGFRATLGEPEGSVAAWWTAAAGVLVVGLLMSQSRGGIVSFAASLPVFALLTRRRLLAATLIGAMLLGAVATVDLADFFGGFEARGDNRMELWRDMVRLVPQFPVFGVGLNAFEAGYRPYQTIQGRDLILEAHNDYLQILLEAGGLGALAVTGLLWHLLRAAWRARGEGGLRAGIVAGIAASMVHATVDFNWQIPANAATFAALLGLALAHPEPRD